MREYSGKITLTRNSRGIYSLDTSIGCASGILHNQRGCYGDCYAAKSAKRYGYDFSKTVLRYFENEVHRRKIVLQISRIKLDFVRIGCSGDPSENWAHTIEVCKAISHANKQIVIITRHWTLLTDEQLFEVSKMNICVNTSVSALDNEIDRQRSIEQYKRLKLFCKSILRIVSCDFNIENIEGLRLSQVQHNLFKNEDTLDTVFRPDKSNPFVTDGIINVKSAKFLKQKGLVSKLNKKTYFGNCDKCPEMCGIRMKNENHIYQTEIPIFKQLPLFGKVNP